MSPKMAERIAALKASASRKPHGTRARYVGAKCRCVDCRSANTRWMRQRTKTAIFDGKNPIIDATEAREHMRRLQKRGMGYKAIADAASVNHNIAFGIRNGSRTKCLLSTSDRILKVGLKQASDGTRIPAGPSWKLLDELIGDGYTRMQLATWLGYRGNPPALQLPRDFVTARNAVRVERLYSLIRAGKLERGAPSPLSPVKPRGGIRRKGIKTGPRDPNIPRCACGLMTLKCAKRRSHHCPEGEKR